MTRELYMNFDVNPASAFNGTRTNVPPHNVADALCDVTGCVRSRKGKAYGSYWKYVFRRGRARHEVLIPCVSLRRLRARSLDAPRLFVDGNSWWWDSAVSVLRGSP